MPQYRRAEMAGGTFFFTVVTFNRKPILTNDTARNILHNAWMDTRSRFPFITEAVCLLPDHIHCIWRLPEGDTNYSMRWKEIKRLFTKGYLEQIGPGEKRNESRIKKGEAAVWQRRFWEHTIRDDDDFNRHLDYIHYNPVKHGLVNNVSDWPWSPEGAQEASFHRYVTNGYYADNWGEIIRKTMVEMEAGE
jgi:putative transposase